MPGQPPTDDDELDEILARRFREIVRGEVLGEVAVHVRGLLAMERARRSSRPAAAELAELLEWLESRLGVPGG
jgi:hypothetical protein